MQRSQDTHYHDRQFSILAKVRNQFHLEETFCIKTQKPILCRHPECIQVFSPNSTVISCEVKDIRSLAINQSEFTCNFFFFLGGIFNVSK